MIEKIAELDNLHEAFLRAARGKRGKAAVMRFADRIGENLDEMRRSLLSGKVECGGYHFFTIYDPKQRVICAAQFRDRVLFHAIMRVCHSIFDDYQIYDSYASRPGKGTYKALERAQHYCRCYRWFAKLDMKKYFDSIDHNVMMHQLAGLIKDHVLLDYFSRLLASYEVSAGKGVPIGNLTSQYFANHYLSPADHYAKEILKVKGFVRYMDDVLFFDNDKELLKRQVALYIRCVERELLLAVHPSVLNRTAMGVPFLGYVAFGDNLRLNGRSMRRLRHKMLILNMMLQNDEIDDRIYAVHATSLLSFASKAECKPLLHRMSVTPGMYPQGL